MFILNARCDINANRIEQALEKMRQEELESDAARDAALAQLSGQVQLLTSQMNEVQNVILALPVQVTQQFRELGNWLLTSLNQPRGPSPSASQQNQLTTSGASCSYSQQIAGPSYLNPSNTTNAAGAV